MCDKAFRQNEVLIGLLARSTIGLQVIWDIVTRNKKDPGAYVRVYNSLRGATSVSEAAKIADVKPPTMSVILSSWEEQGIIYDISDGFKPQYVRLLSLPEKPPAH